MVKVGVCLVLNRSGDIHYYNFYVLIIFMYSFFLPSQEKLALQRKALELEDELKVQIRHQLFIQE